jgi:hypothetical protein
MAAVSTSAPNKLEIWLRRLPSPLVGVAVAQLSILVAFTVARGPQDTDYWWHVTTGRLIAKTGALPMIDPFSFTYGGHWVLHEWLGELLIYLSVTAVGIAATSAIFGLMAGLPFVLLAFDLRRRGVRTLTLAIVTSLGVWVTASYALLRPQVLSWLMLAALIVLLRSFGAGSPRRVLWLTPFFMLWANLHGLYVVGLAVVAVYVLFTLARETPLAGAGRWAVAALGAALAGSLLTPSGVEGVMYPLRYIDAGDWGLAHISEWQSPNFHDVTQLGLLALIMAVAVTGIRLKPGWIATLAVLGLTMALLAVRNGPVAAVLVTPALVIALQSRLPALRSGESTATRDQLWRRVIELAAASIVAIAALVALPTLGGSSRTDYFPVSGADRLVALQPAARVLGEYSWGGYLINRLYSRGGRVFVDGRNDMYGDAILEDYSTAVTAGDGWGEILRRYRVTAILLPPDLPLVRGPAQDAGWCEAYRDGHQVLLLRDCPAA